MEFTMRPATPAERLYADRQSQQITMQTGCVGYLRGDVGESCDTFHTTWEDRPGDEKTGEFQTELDGLVKALHSDEQYGSVLKDRAAMGRYCAGHPEGGFNDGSEFAFRTDTARYSYLIRLSPYKSEENLFIYCYRREWLDQHTKRAEKGIRFVGPDNREKFRIPDGEIVRIITDEGMTRDHVARYVDDCHVEIGFNGLHDIRELAERLERIGSKVIPLRSTLPDKCYSTLIATGLVVILKRGETGYYKTDIPFSSKEEAKALVDEYNKKLGVTKAQAEAMKAGSMFGWTCPAADPKNYDEQGQPIKPDTGTGGDER